MALLILGTHFPHHESPPVTLDPQHLLGNLWLIGQSKSGRSTTLANLAIQLMYEGWGFAFLGAGSQTLLHQVPRPRIPDTIFLNPFSPSPVVWNPLQQVDPQYQGLVASQMVSVFEAMLESGSFMYRSADVLRQA